MYFVNILMLILSSWLSFFKRYISKINDPIFYITHYAFQ